MPGHQGRPSGPGARRRVFLAPPSPAPSRPGLLRHLVRSADISHEESRPSRTTGRGSWMSYPGLFAARTPSQSPAPLDRDRPAARTGGCRFRLMSLAVWARNLGCG